MAAHPYLDWPGPIAFAHRGGASDNPENTMPAFAHAVGLGYRYVETDVHATRDGVLVAFHDPDLARTCGVDANIHDMVWTDLAELRVDGAEAIPRLDDLLDAFPEHRFNIDCKADSAAEALASAIRRHDCFDRVCVGSFSDRRLRRLRRDLGERLCTSYGPAQVASLRVVNRIAGGGHAAQVPVKQGPLTVLTRRFIETAHRNDIHVHVWTIDDPSEMHRLLDLGVDGVMTDRPQTLKDVLVSRGQWFD